MKVSLLTSSDESLDDRIFFHMAVSLTERGDQVQVISSKENREETKQHIRIDSFDDRDISKKEKIATFISRLRHFSPERVICKSPLTILAAHRYAKNQSPKVQVIYDVTEWYPSKKQLEHYAIPIRWLHFIKLFFYNLVAASYSDAFIFGEQYKSKPYRFLFSQKPFTYVSYYPALKYIHYSVPQHPEKELHLCYSGKLNKDKGFDNFISVLEALTKLDQQLKIKVKLIGWYEGRSARENYEKRLDKLPQQVSISFYDRQEFQNYLDLISDIDIFLDLRSNDLENRHCLPIKLFYYAAFGRPVIYTGLKAIQKEVDILSFGHLVRPDDSEQIAGIIINYIRQPELYIKHCNNARRLAEERYNWDQICPDLFQFIDKLMTV